MRVRGGKHWGVPTVRGVPTDRDADFSRFGKISFGERQVPDHTCGLIIDQLVSLQVESSVEFYDLQKKLVVSFKEQQRLNRVKGIVVKSVVVFCGCSSIIGQGPRFLCS